MQYIENAADYDTSHSMRAQNYPLCSIGEKNLQAPDYRRPYMHGATQHRVEIEQYQKLGILSPARLFR